MEKLFSDEDGEIVFNKQAEHTPSKAVTMKTTPDSSDTKMDAIMKARQSISSQNKGIDLKIEQQDQKPDVQVQEIRSSCKKPGSSNGVSAQIMR